MLNDSFHGYNVVIEFIKSLLKQLKKEEKSSWCDPDFGPTDTDEYGAFSLYWTGKPPPAVGNSRYPDPTDLRWDRPVWKNGSHEEDSGETGDGDNEDDEQDDEYDEYDEDDYGGSSGGGNEKWCTKGELFKGGIAANDVKQGKLGDCWFLSALATLATQPDKLRSCFCMTLVDEEWCLFGRKGLWEKCSAAGIIVCRFMKNFEWYYVIIDDRIPVCDNASGKPVFAHGDDPDELWVPLIEKAYAKLHGSYNTLIGGYIDYGLSDLTGMVSEQVVLRPTHPGYHESTGKLWSGEHEPSRAKGNYGRPIDTSSKRSQSFFQDLMERYRGGSLMGCSIQPDPGKKNGAKVEAKVGHGLHQRHAYSIVGVYEIEYSEVEVEKWYQEAQEYMKNEDPKVDEESAKTRFFLNMKENDIDPAQELDYESCWKSNEIFEKYKKGGGEKILRFVACRNPWGRGEWTGPFGDESLPLFFRYRLNKAREDYWDALNDRIPGTGNETEDEIENKAANVNVSFGNDDGIFHMEYEDWKANMTIMFRCLNFTSDPQIKGMRIKGKWTQDVAGGGVHLTTWYINPKLNLEVEDGESCNFFMSLSQEDHRLKHGVNHNKNSHPIGFHIVRREEEESLKVNLPPPYAPFSKNPSKKINFMKMMIEGEPTRETDDQAMYKFNHATSCWCTLGPGKYYIIPSIYKNKQIGSFYFSIYGDGKWTLEDGEKILGGKTSEEKKIVHDPEMQQKLKKDLLFEEVREKFITVAEKRGIHISTLLSMFDSTGKDGDGSDEKSQKNDKPVLLTPTAFKSRLLELGFMNSDITTEGPNNDFHLLAGEDDLLSEEEFYNIFQQELEDKAMYAKEKTPPPEDDLLFVPPPTEIAGNLYINVVEGRDLQLPAGWFNKGSASSGLPLKRKCKLLDIQLASPVQQMNAVSTAQILLAALEKTSDTSFKLTVHLDRPVRCPVVKSHDGVQTSMQYRVTINDCHALIDGEHTITIGGTDAPGLKLKSSVADGTSKMEWQNGDLYVATNVPKLIERSGRQNPPTFTKGKQMYMFWDEDVRLTLARAQGVKDNQDIGVKDGEVPSLSDETHPSIKLPYEHYDDDEFMLKYSADVVPKYWREVPIDAEEWEREGNGSVSNALYITRFEVIIAPGNSTGYLKDVENQNGGADEGTENQSLSNAVEDPDPAVPEATSRPSSMNSVFFVDDALVNKTKDLQLLTIGLGISKDTSPTKWYLKSGFVAIKEREEAATTASLSGDKQSTQEDAALAEKDIENTNPQDNADKTFLKRHKSKQLKDMEQKRLQKFKQFANKKRRQKLLKRDDDEEHEIRFVDVIKVSRDNGKSSMLEPLEYLAKTKHDLEPKEKPVKPKGFKRPDVQKKDVYIYFQLANYINEVIIRRVFTIIDVLENVSMGPSNTPRKPSKLESKIIEPNLIPIWQRCMRIEGMENTLSVKDLESQNMTKWFNKFDKNKSGSIDLNEFRSALKSMGFILNKNEVKTLMERFDREGDGEIDYKEFSIWLNKKTKLVKRRSISQILAFMQKIYVESLLETPEFQDPKQFHWSLSLDDGVLQRLKNIFRSGIIEKLVSLRTKTSTISSETDQAKMIELIDEWEMYLENEITLEELRRVATVFQPQKGIKQSKTPTEFFDVFMKRSSRENYLLPSQAGLSQNQQYMSYISDTRANVAGTPILHFPSLGCEPDPSNTEDPLDLYETKLLAKKALAALGSIPGQITEDVGVTEAFKKFPVTRIKDKTIVRYTDFVGTLLDKMNDVRAGDESVDKKKEEIKKPEDAEENPEQPHKEITPGSTDEDVTSTEVEWYIKSKESEMFPALIKLRMVLDELKIGNEVASSDLCVLMKGHAVEHIEEKLRYLLRRKANTADGLTFWLVTLYVDRKRKSIVAIARDPETQQEHRLTVPEVTDYLSVLGDFLDPKKINKMMAPFRGAIRGQDIKYSIKGTDPFAMEKYMFTLNSLLEDSVKGLKEKFGADKLFPVFVSALMPAEEKACRDLANRLLLTRNAETSEVELVLGESAAFVEALQDAFAANKFDFFINVTPTALTFRVENTEQSAESTTSVVNKGRKFKDIQVPDSEAPASSISRRKQVLDAIRTVGPLRAYLSGTSSVLDVIYQSSDGNTTETTDWMTFVAHLENMKNPYVSLEMLPKHDKVETMDTFKNFFQRTKADKDGGSQPWFNTHFEIPYRPTTNSLPVKHTDVMQLGFSRKKRIWSEVRSKQSMKANDMTAKQLFEFIAYTIIVTGRDGVASDVGLEFSWLTIGHESGDKAWWGNIKPASLPLKTKMKIYNSICSAPGRGIDAFNDWARHNLLEATEAGTTTLLQSTWVKDDSSPIKGRLQYVPYTFIALEKIIRCGNDRFVMRDPRYVVVSVRRDPRDGLLCATAYDTRTTNEYEVEGPFGWRTTWDLIRKPCAQTKNSNPPFLTGRPHFVGLNEKEGTPASNPEKKDDAPVRGRRDSKLRRANTIEGFDETGQKSDDFCFSKEPGNVIEGVWRSVDDEVNWQAFVYGTTATEPANTSLPQELVPQMPTLKGEHGDMKEEGFINAINSERWEWLKQNVLHLGKQITPRLSLSAYTAPLVTTKGSGGDQLIGKCDIPISLISSLGFDVGNKWFPLYRNVDIGGSERLEKVGELRLKYCFSTNRKNELVTTWASTDLRSSGNLRAGAQNVKSLPPHALIEAKAWQQKMEKKLEQERRKREEAEKQLRIAIKAAALATNNEKRPSQKGSMIEHRKLPSSIPDKVNDKLVAETKLKLRDAEEKNKALEVAHAELERNLQLALKEKSKLAHTLATKSSSEGESSKLISQEFEQQRLKLEEAERKNEELARKHDELEKRLHSTTMKTSDDQEINGGNANKTLSEHQTRLKMAEESNVELIKKQANLEKKLALAEKAKEQAELLAAESLKSTTGIPKRPSTASYSGGRLSKKLTDRQMEQKRKDFEKKMRSMMDSDEEWNQYLGEVNRALRLIGKQLIVRNPANKERPLQNMQRFFEMNAGDDNCLDYNEFRNCLKDFNVSLEEKQLKMIMLHFDYDQDKSLCIDEIMFALRKALSMRSAAWEEKEKSQDDDDDGLGALPGHVTKHLAANGRWYFRNHLTKTTSWQDPRVMGSTEVLDKPAAGSGINAVKGKKGASNTIL